MVLVQVHFRLHGQSSVGAIGREASRGVGGEVGDLGDVLGGVVRLACDVQVDRLGRSGRTGLRRRLWVLALLRANATIVKDLLMLYVFKHSI